MEKLDTIFIDGLDQVCLLIPAQWLACTGYAGMRGSVLPHNYVSSLLLPSSSSCYSVSSDASSLPGYLGSAQPSVSNFGNVSTLSVGNSHMSQNDHGIAERELIQPVPVNAGLSRIPAPRTVVSTAQQPHHIQQDVQQHRFANEAQMNQAFPDKIFVAHQKVVADPENQVFQDKIFISHQEVLSDAERRNLERQQNASTDNVRRLRELIRERYALDLYVWEKRNVRRANRKKIEPKCKKADSILQEIYFIVNTWEEDLFDKEEWEMVKRIKAGLSAKQQENGESGEPAIWGDLPPWDRRDVTEGAARLGVAEAP